MVTYHMPSWVSIFLPVAIIIIAIGASLAKRTVQEGLDGGQCCKQWVQTLNCQGHGPIDTDSAYVKSFGATRYDCTRVVDTHSSGYCLCVDGSKVAYSDCGHQPFSCQDACAKNCVPKAKGCTLPAKFGANVVRGMDSYDPGTRTTVSGCSPGWPLDSGASCNVQCSAGSNPLGGTTTYSCNTGEITPATLTCSDPVCTLPTQFGTGIVPAKTNPCSTGATMKNQETCDVECDTGYAGDGGSGTYSCEGGSLKPAALKCHKTGCTLPSSFPDHMSGGGQNQCKVGGSLSTGGSCGLVCDPGYMSSGGSLGYTCKDGTLTSPTSKCTEKPCQLPTSLGSGITAGDKDGCVADQKMKGGEKCSVKCAKGYKPVGGSTEYSCSKGNLTAATLRCEPVTCPLPGQLGPGVEGKGHNACITGASLNAGQSCDVACQSGYRSKGGTTVYQCPDSGQMLAASLKCERISCPLPHDFGDGVTWGGASPCEPGSSLLGGQQCSVKCGMGYSGAGGNPNYVCGQTGILNKSTLACSRNKCRLPGSFGEGKTPGGENPCESGGVIDSGNSCSVQCQPGYKPISGDSEYMCDQRGMLSDATLQCEPISCDLPVDFGDGVMGTGTSPCSPGTSLIAGDSCEVKCEEGYDMVGEEVNYAHGGISKEFHCSGAGFLTEPGIKCKETKIRPYNSVWAIDFGGVRG